MEYMYSDLKELQKGVFELEKGDPRCGVKPFETVLLLFAGAELESTTRKFNPDDEV